MSKCGSYRKHKGGAIGDGSEAGSGAFPLHSAPDSFGGKVIGANVSGYTNSQAAQMSKIPQSITEQGMGFQALTSKFHRKRSTRKQRKQRGGGPAPYPDAVGALLPKDMTGPMQLAHSGIAGGSGTAKLDDFLMQTRSAVQQHGGAKKSRKAKGKKQTRKQKLRKGKKQQQSRQGQQQQRQQQKQQRKSQKKQRGGAHNAHVQHGPAEGPYTLLSGADLQKAGLNPQWFDENQVNPNFGGAITVPGGKLN
jgi:hypothetical protein